MAAEIDIYDNVLVRAPGDESGDWIHAVILEVNMDGTYEVQLSKEGTVIKQVPFDSIKQLDLPEDELMHLRQLGAAFAAENSDEDRFQLEAAMFFSKVLARLEDSDPTRHSSSPSASHVRRSSIIASRRSRFS